MFYVLAAVTRLAFYNVEDDAVRFVGAPTPAAALLCATPLLLPTPAWAASWPLAVAGAAMIASITIPRPRPIGLAVFACWATPSSDGMCCDIEGLITPRGSSLTGPSPRP